MKLRVILTDWNPKDDLELIIDGSNKYTKKHTHKVYSEKGAFNQESEELIHLITTWRLNQSFLAGRIGMNVATFSNNVIGRKYYTFTNNQIKALKNVLKELIEDIDKMIEPA